MPLWRPRRLVSTRCAAYATSWAVIRPGVSASRAPMSATVTRGRACRGTGRHLGVDADFKRVFLRWHDLFDRRFEQRMASITGASRYNRVALAVILRVYDDAIGAC